MSVLPYLVGLLGALALVITLLLAAYCLLYPIAARQAESDAFLDADMEAAAEACRRQYSWRGERKRSAFGLNEQMLFVELATMATAFVIAGVVLAALWPVFNLMTG